MKTIYFVRHAKAQKEGTSDFERELSQRGKQNAKDAGKRLKKMKIRPDIIFSSDAKRAVKTATILKDELNFEKDIKFEHRFYISSCEFYIEFINKIDDKFENVFIVAHNPEITEICELLSDSAITNIPTCGIFSIKFDVDKFADIKQHCSCEVLFFDYPKKYLN